MAKPYQMTDVSTWFGPYKSCLDACNDACNWTTLTPEEECALLACALENGYMECGRVRLFTLADEWYGRVVNE